MDLAKMISEGAERVLNPWTKQRRREEREKNAHLRREEELTRAVRLTPKDIVWDALPDIYDAVTSNNRFSALTRQLGYRLRPLIMEEGIRFTSRTMKTLTSVLIPRFIIEHPKLTADWDVIYDARGHIIEPHTDEVISLGTVDVREYVGGFHRCAPAGEELNPKFLTERLFPTKGALHRYGAVIYIEKEGFHELLERHGFAMRHDVALMSSKGHSVMAARSIVDALPEIPVLVVRDFDVAGFNIAHTLRHGSWRDEFTERPNVIDIGLRLEDVKRYQLQSERVQYKDDRRGTLEEHGATEEEIEFLCGEYHGGERVELNAFSTEDLIRWLEEKLMEHGVQKVIPDDEVLAAAYRRSFEIRVSQGRIREIQEEARRTSANAQVPKDLADRVKKRLKANPAMPWDQAVALEVERHV